MEVPPVPTITHDDEHGRERGMTASTASTATPPKLEGGNLDLGGDFSSMLSNFGKRSSQITLKNDGSAVPRSLTDSRKGKQPADLEINGSLEPSPPLLTSQGSRERLLARRNGSPVDTFAPPPHRSQSPSSFKASNRPAGNMEDDDAKLLQDSVLAGRYLSGNNEFSSVPLGRFRRDEDNFGGFSRSTVLSNSSKNDENMFEGRWKQSAISSAGRSPPAVQNQPRNKVMTPAQFEQYRQNKQQHASAGTVTKQPEEDDEEDEINYDDDDDEAEKSKRQTKQRRKQEATMTIYRQQMMKVTGESPMQSSPSPSRPILPASMSAPQLTLLKAPSPDFRQGVSDEDDDEEVPLAILQAHGFPNKNRPPVRLSTVGSNPNLRATARQSTLPGRPSSAIGDGSSSGAQRQSSLPAFARNLPQDPFVGAGIARPAVRESLTFGAGASGRESVMPPGGLVGVIASEERSRAMRRGSPNMESQRFSTAPPPGPQSPGFDPVAGIPPHMMYGNGSNVPMMSGGQGMPAGMGPPGMLMPGMHPQMGQPMLSAGEQAQIQMTQQMQQFMQMQMQFMQMMTGNQPGAPPMQQPYGAGMPGSQTIGNLPNRQSMMGDVMMEQPHRADAGMRTMSMVHPPSVPFMQPHPGYASSLRNGAANAGYTPSIAPSERSNVGLPGRYRPVSQAPQIPGDKHRSNSMSGALESFKHSMEKSTITVVSKTGNGSDDDDEEGWEAMKAKREKKKSLWRGKKTFGAELEGLI